MKSCSRALALVFCFVFPASAPADQRDSRLDDLFERLRQVETVADARLIELEIWQIWSESGRDDVDRLLAKGVREMTARQMNDALTTFTRVVDEAPDFAEGWNKRATAHYLKKNYTESVYDIRRTLLLEPRHFGALSGMGLILVALGDEAGAANAFRQVLTIHPNAQSARRNLELIERRIRDRTL